MGLKEAYQEKADAQLREWQNHIEHIKTRSKPAHLDPLTYERQPFEHLEECCHIAQLRLNELRESRDERWEFAKQAVERALIDLKRALDESAAGQINSIVKLQNSRAHIYEPFHHGKNQ